MDVLVTLPEGWLRDTFVTDELRDRLESLGTVTWIDGDEQLSESELRDRIGGVDVLVTGWGSPQVTAEVVDAADDLDLIAHTGGSVGPHASEAVYDAGIRVVSANDVMADHTAEHVLGCIIARLHRIPALHADMRDGEWGAEAYDLQTIHRKRVGLVGLGTIGRNLLDHLSGFDVSVRVYDPYVDESDLADWPFAEKADLDAALDADIVSVHAARTEETIGMLDAERLAQIPDGALFVNTARAEIVEEDALLDELRSGRIDGVFDVFHEEPLPADHELRSLDNVLLTPHVGGSEIRPPLTEAVIEEIERFDRGEPLEREIPREQWRHMTR